PSGARHPAAVVGGGRAPARGSRCPHDGGAARALRSEAGGAPRIGGLLASGRARAFLAGLRLDATPPLVPRARPARSLAAVPLAAGPRRGVLGDRVRAARLGDGSTDRGAGARPPCPRLQAAPPPIRELRARGRDQARGAGSQGRGRGARRPLRGLRLPWPGATHLQARGQPPGDAVLRPYEADGEPARVPAEALGPAPPRAKAAAR